MISFLQQYYYQSYIFYLLLSEYLNSSEYVFIFIDVCIYLRNIITKFSFDISDNNKVLWRFKMFAYNFFDLYATRCLGFGMFHANLYLFSLQQRIVKLI